MRNNKFSSKLKCMTIDEKKKRRPLAIIFKFIKKNCYKF